MKQKEQHDSKSRERKLNVGDNVFVKNCHHGDKWLPGVTQKNTGPVSFVVKLTDGRVCHCYQNQLRRRSMEVQMDPSVEAEVFVSPTEISLPLASPTEPPVPTPKTNFEGPSAMDPNLVTTDTAIPSNLADKTFPKHTCHCYKRWSVQLGN